MTPGSTGRPRSRIVVDEYSIHIQPYSNQVPLPAGHGRDKADRTWTEPHLTEVSLNISFHILKGYPEQLLWLTFLSTKEVREVVL